MQRRGKDREKATEEQDIAVGAQVPVRDTKSRHMHAEAQVSSMTAKLETTGEKIMVTVLDQSRAVAGIYGHDPEKQREFCELLLSAVEEDIRRTYEGARRLTLDKETEAEAIRLRSILKDMLVAPNADFRSFSKIAWKLKELCLTCVAHRREEILIPAWKSEGREERSCDDGSHKNPT